MIKSAEPMTPERKAAVRAAIATLDKELMSKRKELEELRTNLTGRFSATVIEEEDEPKADKAIEIVPCILLLLYSIMYSFGSVSTLVL